MKVCISWISGHVDIEERNQKEIQSLVSSPSVLELEIFQNGEWKRVKG